MSIEIIRPVSHEAWLQARNGGIGSSEVGTILGINPFETPYQLWRRKIGLDDPKEETFAMKAGHYLEDAVSLFYQDATGRKVIKRSAGDWIVRDKENPYLQVSPDRTFWINPEDRKTDDNKGILECKTTQMEIDPEAVPNHWFCQLQYQLGVSRLPMGSLAWLTRGRSFGTKDFTFDQDFFRMIKDAVEKFWFENIKKQIEPALVNVDDVLAKFPSHVQGKSIVANTENDLVNILGQIKILKTDISEMDERRSELEDSVKMIMGDAESVISPEYPLPLATWKKNKDSVTFDQKRFQAENPDLYKCYTSPKTGVRVFKIK